MKINKVFYSVSDKFNNTEEEKTWTVSYVGSDTEGVELQDANSNTSNSKEKSHIFF